MSDSESSISNPCNVSESEFEQSSSSSDVSFPSMQESVELNNEHENKVNANEVASITRKRIRMEEKWMRNVRKKNRASGLSYISSRGVMVPPKQLKGICSCLHKCYTLFTNADMRRIFDSFYNLESFDKQTAFLCSLISMSVSPQFICPTAERRRFNTRIYKLHDENNVEIRVCKTFFKNIFDISDGRLTRALRNKSHMSNDAAPPLDRRGKQTATKTPANVIDEIKNFITQFPTYVGRIQNVEFLAPDVNISILYKMYTKKTSMPVSKFIFTKIFSQNFNLHFRTPPVSKNCKKCDEFTAKMLVINEADERHSLEVEHKLHLRKAELAQNGMHEDSGLANEEYSVFAFDLMKTLPTPVLSSGRAYYKRQLWTYCLGIHNLQTKSAYMYTWHEGMASRGPQEIGSCILHYIKNFVKTPKVIMYSAECGGQNRNIHLSTICNYIVTSPDIAIQQIDHKFLLSGHSNLPCDKDFGYIKNNKRNFKNIFVPNDWHQAILTARKKTPFQVINMTADTIMSTSALERNITKRKVEWPKIQWLKFSSKKPFIMQYKYSNDKLAEFTEEDIGEQNRTPNHTPLCKLFPNGRPIETKKHKDLQELKKYIPPSYHGFYDNLKHSQTAIDDDLMTHGFDDFE